MNTMDEAPVSPAIRVVIAAPFPEIVGLHERAAEYADQLDVCGAVMDAGGVVDQTRVLQPDVLVFSDRLGDVGDVAARLAAVAPTTRLVVLRSDPEQSASSGLADAVIGADASADTLRQTIVNAAGRHLLEVAPPAHAREAVAAVDAGVDGPTWFWEAAAPAAATADPGPAEAEAGPSEGSSAPDPGEDGHRGTAEPPDEVEPPTSAPASATATGDDPGSPALEGYGGEVVAHRATGGASGMRRWPPPWLRATPVMAPAADQDAAAAVSPDTMPGSDDPQPATVPPAGAPAADPAVAPPGWSAAAEGGPLPWDTASLPPLAEEGQPDEAPPGPPDGEPATALHPPADATAPAAEAVPPSSSTAGPLWGPWVPANTSPDPPAPSADAAEDAADLALPVAPARDEGDPTVVAPPAPQDVEVAVPPPTEVPAPCGPPAPQPEPEPEPEPVTEPAPEPVVVPADPAVPDSGAAPAAGAVAEPAAAPAAEPIPAQPLRRTRRSGRARAETILVFSGKGGVGKSVVATNLAVALSKRGAAVAIIDLNLQYGDVGVLLHLESHPTSIESLAQQGEQIDREFLDEVLAPGPEQVRALLAPTSPEFADLVTAASLRAILREMSRSFDYIIVDSASHLEELVLEVMEIADQILMVTTFNITAVKDTKITLKLLQSLGIERERIAVVLNQTRAKISFPRSDIEKSLRFAMLAHLPYEARVDDTIDTGKPMVLTEPRSEFAKQMGIIVDYLAPDEPAASTPSDRQKGPRRRFGRGR